MAVLILIGVVCGVFLLLVIGKTVLVAPWLERQDLLVDALITAAEINAQSCYAALSDMSLVRPTSDPRESLSRLALSWICVASETSPFGFRITPLTQFDAELRFRLGLLPYLSFSACMKECETGKAQSGRMGAIARSAFWAVAYVIDSDAVNLDKALLLAGHVAATFEKTTTDWWVHMRKQRSKAA